ncbi:hypothetical protein Dsin_001857 [Dipteronia sinensis]|uniref:DUF4283 domain-containing protein n=1 Tax=Dipteronia sinensis TaxID=43782 RepID=A0AAE0B4P5_9ROSI|nr:hypothetical protein Dsin_001857 [Dipteronia sinensis]
MVDSSPYMDPSPKHPSLPCLGSKRFSTSYSLVLPPGSTMENPPFPEASSSSTSSVLPPTISLQDPKRVLSSSPQTLTITANLGNNGGLEDSSFAAHLKNELGKMKEPMDQCNRSEKPALDVHRPDQLHQVPFSSFGMVEKPASKGEACPSAIVEDQKVQLKEVSSLSNYVLPHNKGISITPPLVNKDASNAIGQVPPIISEKSPISYSNVLKGAHHNPLMDPSSKNGSKVWKNCLVGYFIEKKLPFSLVNNIAMRIWGNRGLLEVLANEKGFYFFKFSDDEACSNVLEAGPWLFAGRMLKQEWRRVNKRDAPTVCSPQACIEPPPFGSLKDDEVISTGNTENEPSLYPTNLPNHDQCNNVDPPSMASPDQCNHQCTDVDSPTTASPDHSLWHSKIKNIDEVTVIGLSSPTESSSKKKKRNRLLRKARLIARKLR